MVTHTHTHTKALLQHVGLVELGVRLEQKRRNKDKTIKMKEEKKKTHSQTARADRESQSLPPVSLIQRQRDKQLRMSSYLMQ